MYFNSFDKVFEVAKGAEIISDATRKLLKDNSLTKEEEKKLRRVKKQGRKRIYRETAAAETIRKAGIRNEDENVRTEALDQAMGLAVAGSAEARNYAQDIKRSNYGKKLHMICEKI